MANWDNQIDDAARQMTGGEPDAGFNASVFARIDRETGQRRGWSMWVWPAAALAAAAALALVMVRSPSPSEVVDAVRVKRGITAESNPDTTVRLNPGNTDEPQDRGGVPSSTPSAAESAGQARGAFARQSYVASAGRAETGAVNDAVAQAGDLAPPPIEIDPIGVESMEAMESIQVATLAVARLDVPAIAEE